ncbi:MAG TPA: pitrilysin family protein [Candidatus Binatia bacterium]|jgi:zinc protease|nr:pitrilysin family protein [Candidatus Binatia bacterium]
MTAIQRSIYLAAAVLLLLSSPASVLAQEAAATPLSKVERKNRVPLSKEVLDVKLQRPVERKLSNGITVLILEDHRFPVVTTEFHIRGAGALFEPEKLKGLAGVTAEMLREGTRTRTSREIAEQIDRMGASMWASSGFGSVETGFGASGLKDNFDAWFGLAMDVLLNPSFPEVELNRMKERIKVRLRQQRSSPGFLADERFALAVYGSHPAAIVSATPESIDALTPEALAVWHRERYDPARTILGIAGDVRVDEIMSKLEKWLAKWPRLGIEAALPPNPTPIAARKIFLIDRPDSVQTTVALGNIAIDRRSDDYIPMVVMNQILGGGSAARLFLNLREEKGYTYGVYSSFSASEYPGPWRAGGNMRTEVTDGAFKEFFYEFRRIRDEKAPAAELDEAKRSVVANFALALEQPARMLGFALTRKIYGLPDDYWDTYPEKVMAVTADDVERVARKYLNPDTAQIVAVGDARKIKPVLGQYGGVEVYDNSGKAVAAAADVKPPQ